MLQSYGLYSYSYLILSFEVFDEDCIRRLANQPLIRILTVHCVCSVLDFEFNLKTYNVLTWLQHWVTQSGA